MIFGIGTDCVEIARFERWALYPRSRLNKVFSTGEIDYCLAKPELAAQRFAARFAAKEALYKALWAGGFRMKFFSLCRFAEITLDGLVPALSIDWQGLDMKPLRSHVSLSHHRTMALAFVVLESH